jgi:N-acetylmuramoyl-L-alanine amidase
LGAVCNGLIEKNVVGDIAKDVFELLKNDGYHVSLIYNCGKLLKIQDRVQLIKQLRADLFISIHADVARFKPSLTGPRFYFMDSRNNQNIRLAEAIKDGLIEEDLKDENFSIDRYGKFKASFNVLRANGCPAVLIEVGFLSNKKDSHDLAMKQYRDFVGRGIYRGIKNYLQHK